MKTIRCGIRCVAGINYFMQVGGGYAKGQQQIQTNGVWLFAMEG